METGIKITTDGFVWKMLSRAEAERVFETGLFELYFVYEDESECLVNTESDFNSLMSTQDGPISQFAIEVGFCPSKQSINNIMKTLELTSIVDIDDNTPLVFVPNESYFIGDHNPNRLWKVTERQVVMGKRLAFKCPECNTQFCDRNEIMVTDEFGRVYSDADFNELVGVVKVVDENNQLYNLNQEIMDKKFNKEKVKAWFKDGIKDALNSKNAEENFGDNRDFFLCTGALEHFSENIDCDLNLFNDTDSHDPEMLIVSGEFYEEYENLFQEAKEEAWEEYCEKQDELPWVMTRHQIYPSNIQITYNDDKVIDLSIDGCKGEFTKEEWLRDCEILNKFSLPSKEKLISILETLNVIAQ